MARYVIPCVPLADNYAQSTITLKVDMIQSFENKTSPIELLVPFEAIMRRFIGADQLPALNDENNVRVQ